MKIHYYRSNENKLKQIYILYSTIPALIVNFIEICPVFLKTVVL